MASTGQKTPIYLFYLIDWKKNPLYQTLMKHLTYFYLFIVLLFFSCQSEQRGEVELPPPNIVWINAEDLSPAFGCYGDDFATTPNIDKLAKNGVVYTNSYATAPICAPSRSALATGLYATAMGTQHLRSETPKPDFIQTLPEHMRQAGYFTSLNGKTDYNFDPTGVWEYWKNDNAPWRQRKDDRPFYSMFVFGVSHEGAGNFKDKYDELTKDLPKEMFHSKEEVEVPPYYPDNETSRDLWARYYDLISVFDQKVGEVVDNLEEDGLLENTIVFVFSDHGFGMPRYKRWLNDTGIRVPLVIYTPEKYKDYFPTKRGQKTDELVSFVDYVPTVMNLAGLEPAETMQGRAFLGKNLSEQREYVYGARSRADDMYETSRAVRDDRYIYIRHYMPQYPYIQDGYIFSDRKESLKLLRAEHQANNLPPASEAMWHPKPIEELYDLKDDPQELNNLAESPEFAEVKERLHSKMTDWILRHRDIGFLHEAEFMIRSKGSTPYEYAQSDDYQLENILAAAEKVGKASVQEFIEGLKNSDSGVRYWSVIGLLNLGEEAKSAESDLLNVLKNDTSPSVQIAAAETLCGLGNCEPTLPILEKYLKDERVWVTLYAARTTQLIGEAARPLIPTIKQVLENNLGEPGAKRKYKDFNYAAFISWPLEWSLQEMGEPVEN